MWDGLLASVDPSAVEFMVRIGETAVRFAREHGAYQDQTGNLRHSIGFIVVQDGKVVHEWYEQGWQEAVTATKMHLHSLVSGYPKDTVLIWGSGDVYKRQALGVRVCTFFSASNLFARSSFMFVSNLIAKSGSAIIRSTVTGVAYIPFARMEGRTSSHTQSWNCSACGSFERMTRR